MVRSELEKPRFCSSKATGTNGVGLLKPDMVNLSNTIAGVGGILCLLLPEAFERR